MTTDVEMNNGQGTWAHIWECSQGGEAFHTPLAERGESWMWECLKCGRVNVHDHTDDPPAYCTGCEALTA